MRREHHFGWRPSKPDFRDYRVRRRAVRLPNEMDLRTACSAVEDQLALGACVANAGVGALEYYHDRGWDLPLGARDYSRLFLYWAARSREGTTTVDSGVEPRDMLKVMLKLGTPLESLWPYAITRYTEKPPKAAYADAKKRLIKSYQAVDPDVDAICAQLALANPVLFGATVYESFQSDAVARTGMVPVPKSTESAIGGHMMLLVGYRRSARCFICRNSWSAAWGDHGYCYIPFQWVSLKRIAADYWTITV